MQSQDNIIKCYDAVADNYADEFKDELSKKHFDRFLLKEFAKINKDKGRFADFGCGPGQTTKFLFGNGITDIIGIDISPGMIKAAKKLFPEIKFETGDMLNLSYKTNYFGAAIAFYAVVHFTYDQIKTALGEINKVLKNGGHFLFSFHIGDEKVHHNTFLGKPVDVDFYFLRTEKIMDLLNETGFEIVNAIERYPYKDAEYPSKRAYLWVEKI
jgi:ubiquinone/menaquinone biosynthesis C-methylase UbiE